MERQARLLPQPGGVDVQPLTIEELYAEWLRPARADAGRALLYLHGGGYTMGSCNTHRALAAHIARASRLPALLLGYRLAPEHPYPAALQDARAAWCWLLEQGIAPDKVVVAGDSAGGGLAVALALALRADRQPLPGGLACLSPWADLTLSGETFVSCAQTDPLISLETSRQHAARYVGQHDPASPLVSPVFAELDGFPPLLIHVGEHEVLRSDSQRLAENARRAGVAVTLEVWEGMWHDFQMYIGLLPEAQHSIRRIGVFASGLG